MKKAAAPSDAKKEEGGMKVKELMGKMFSALKSSNMSEHHLTMVKGPACTRIMKLSPKQLREEAGFKIGEQSSFLSEAAGFGWPLPVIARLCDVNDIDKLDTGRATAIMAAASSGNYDLVDYLAMRKADLSLTNYLGDNIGRGSGSGSSSSDACNENRGGRRAAAFERGEET
jgi:ankyrin repeat protein